MPAKEVNKYLFDILDAIAAIEHIKAQLTDFESFEQNRIFRSAVERELQVVGEAVAQAHKLDKDLPLSDIRRIRHTRNIIVHDYMGIDYEIIWSIIQVYIPKLKKEIEQIFKPDITHD